MKGTADLHNNDAAFKQIHGLVSATLVRNALSYNIPVSILLKGTRGVGKFTTAAQIARQLGLHLFGACFEIRPMVSVFDSGHRSTATIFWAKTMRELRASYEQDLIK